MRGPKDLTAKFVQMANEAGGSDNITAIVGQFKEMASESTHTRNEEATLEEGTI